MQGTVRILYLIDTLGAGGAERLLYNLVKSLDMKIYQPAVVTIYDESAMFPYPYLPLFKDIDVPVYSLGANAQGWQGRIHAIRTYIRLLWQFKPDIVQGYSHYANLISRGARPVCPQHHLIGTILARHTERQLRSERYTSWLSTYIISNSEPNMRLLIERAGVNPTKIETIPNSIDISYFERNPQPRLRQQLCPNAGFVAVMVGRIDPRKDHLVLIEALHILNQAERLPQDFRLILIGLVTDVALQKRLEDKISAYELEQYIRQYPPVENVTPYYHMADICLLPSNSEGFPLVLQEAGIVGKPMIVSKAANAVSVILPGKTGWEFPTGNAHALAECLTEAIYCDQEQLQKMGQNARNKISEKYSIPVIRQQHTALYQELLNKRR